MVASGECAPKSKPESKSASQELPEKNGSDSTFEIEPK
jgi:hypothetical protein